MHRNLRNECEKNLFLRLTINVFSDHGKARIGPARKAICRLLSLRQDRLDWLEAKHYKYTPLYTATNARFGISKSSSKVKKN